MGWQKLFNSGTDLPASYIFIEMNLLIH